MNESSARVVIYVNLGRLGRAIVTVVCLSLIPLFTSPAVSASQTPSGSQYSFTTCYVGETPLQCGIQNLTSSASYRDYAWNTYFGNWLSGPPPGIRLQSGTFSGTFTTVTAAGSWYVLDRVRSNYTNEGYMAFTVAAVRPAVTPVVNSVLTKSAAVGASMSMYTITASNTPTSYDATGLPAGLSINRSNGQITGAPVAAGTVSSTISATNSAGTGSATLVFTISAGTQATLSLSSISATYGTPFTLTSSGGSGTGAVTFSLGSAGTAGCSLIGATTLSAAAPGACQVVVAKAADANYSAATASVSVEVDRATQESLLLTSTTGTFGTDLPMTISGGSGTGAVSYAVTGSGTAGCSMVSSTTLTSSGAGTCLVTATKALDVTYSQASSSATTVTFSARDQTSAVALTSSPVKVFGSALTLAAAGGSGTGALSYSVEDAGTALCSVSGDRLTSTGDVGSTCTVRATRLGDANYLPRDSAAQTVTVTQRAVQPGLEVVAPTIVYRTPTALASTGGAGSGAVSFGVSAAGDAGCSITAGELRTTGGVGTTCVIFARKAESTNYLQASSPDLTVTVTHRSAQEIDFTAPVDREFSTAPFVVSPLSDSGLGVTVSSMTPAVCSVTGNHVTTLLPGACSLRAEQGGDANVQSAPAVTRGFVISRARQSVAWSPILGALSTASPLTMNSAVGADAGAITYTVLDPGATGCAVTDPTVPVLTFDSPGFCVLQAEAAVTATHQAGTSVATFVITAPVPALGGSPAPSSFGADVLGVAKIRSLDPIVENAGLLPGADVVTVDGDSVSVRIEANATSTGLDVLGIGWRLSVSARASDGSKRPLDPGGVLVLTAGSTLDVSGSGFDDRAQVRVYLMGRTMHLGSLMTDQSGDLAGSLVVPMDATIGADTLQINGFTRDRVVRSISLGTRVMAPALFPTAVGTRIFFAYESARLTAKAKRSLLAMIDQLPSGSARSAAVTGAVRATRATPEDASLARRRVSVVSSFLKAHGIEERGASSIRRVPVTNHFRDRRVEITVSSAG